MTLPAQADRVDGILQFDSNGEPTVVSASQFVAGLSGSIIGANYITNNATGDGTTVNFTLSSAPGSKGNLQIYIDGVYQNKATFSLAGTTVTFTEAPPLNASVEFIIGYSIGSTSGDATGIDFTQQGTGAVSRTVANKLYEFVSVKDFGAVGDGVTDDTAAIQAALDYAAISEGLVTVPEGTYKTTSQLTMASGVGLSGEGRRNASIIKAYHTDAAILNLKGSGFCIVKDIYLTTDSTLYPKTGMALGRSSAASAGNHHIENVKIQGYFDAAVFYSIASEVNVINNLYLWNLGGASSAKYGFYTSKADDLSVDSFVTSTNLVANVTGLNIVNSSSDANAACIYIEAAESSGSWNFYGAYLTPYRGSYVEINNATDSQILGPYSFIACSGERLSGGDPIYGFKLTSSVACNFKGLNIIGTRFDFLAGSSHYPFWTDANFTYTTPNVVMQPPEAFPYAVSIYYENKIKGGQFRVGREYEWVAPTLAGSWANQFGSPYAQAGYQKDDTGIVSLRGTLTGGTGDIFTLPANFRPEADMFFGVYANGSMGRIKITSAGVVSLSSGTAPIDLSGINFVAGA
jgi:hypothetical protein